MIALVRFDCNVYVVVGSMYESWLRFSGLIRIEYYTPCLRNLIIQENADNKAYRGQIVLPDICAGVRLPHFDHYNPVMYVIYQATTRP